MRNAHLTLLSVGIVKQAAVDPRLSAALQGGMLGAAGGGTIQLLRRLFQSKRDEEENGSPSILNGLLLGGLGGAGLGYGLGGMGGQEAPAIWGGAPPPGLADAAFPRQKAPSLGLPNNPAATVSGAPDSSIPASALSPLINIDAPARLGAQAGGVPEQMDTAAMLKAMEAMQAQGLGLPANPAATPFGGVSMGDVGAGTQQLPAGAVNAMGNPFAKFK